MRTPAIVVAVDGTEPSQAAVRWAAHEARDSGRPLLLLHILDWEWATARYDFENVQYEAAHRIAEDLIAGIAAQARDLAPGVLVQTEIRVGSPAARLISSSEDADLLVLGHRGSGGFAGLRLGSVSQRVAVHAHCPVVVVRGRGGVDGPVAAGVDGSDGADQVLEAAFTAARARDTSLLAIRSFPPLPPMYWGYLPPAELNTPEQDEAERERLAEQLAPWRAKYPDVPVKALVSHDTAAAALTGVSHSAQLVVVGSRGHGVIAGTLLGSTGLQLLHHAECPVLIVRPHARGGDRR